MVLFISNTWHVSTKKSSSGVLHKVSNYWVVFTNVLLKEPHIVIF
jgi:hypothetical protein